MKEDAAFLRERAWRSRFTRHAATVLLVVWVAGWIFVTLRVPLLGNPFHVLDRLQKNDIEPGTLALLAGLAPIILQVLGFVTAVLLIAIRFAAGLEERYRGIVARSKGGEADPTSV